MTDSTIDSDTRELMGRVALGAWSYGGLHLTPEGYSGGWAGHTTTSADGALFKAYELGLRHWDTADVYGNGTSERMLGTVARQLPRHELFLASKVGYVSDGHGRPYAPAMMRAQFESSLKNLSTDYLDLYYFHHCDFGPDNRYQGEAIELMHGLKAEGKVRLIGLSDWNNARLFECARAMRPDVIQCYHNVVDITFDKSGLRRWAEDGGIHVVFFGVLRQGLLLSKANSPTSFPEGDFRRNIPGFSNGDLRRKLRERAKIVSDWLKNEPEPLLTALVGTVIAKRATTALIGLRNADQVVAASRVNTELSTHLRRRIRALYSDITNWEEPSHEASC